MKEEACENCIYFTKCKYGETNPMAIVPTNGYCKKHNIETDPEALCKQYAEK